MSKPGASKQVWVGRVLSALPVLAMTMSGVMKLAHAPPVLEAWGKFGYPPSTLSPIGVVELLCVVLYVVPRTTVLGAVLIAGYLGGAIATHVRAGEPFVLPLLLGIIAWAGLYLRDERIRKLLPLRSVD